MRKIENLTKSVETLKNNLTKEQNKRDQLISAINEYYKKNNYSGRENPTLLHVAELAILFLFQCTPSGWMNSTIIDSKSYNKTEKNQSEDIAYIYMQEKFRFGGHPIRITTENNLLGILDSRKLEDFWIYLVKNKQTKIGLSEFLGLDQTELVNLINLDYDKFWKGQLFKFSEPDLQIPEIWLKIPDEQPLNSNSCYY